MLSAFFVDTLVLGFTSCKDDEEGAANYTAAATALGNPEVAYNSISSPTAADCITLKAAYQEYIDESNNFDNCSDFTDKQQASLDQAIQDTENAK